MTYLLRNGSELHYRVQGDGAPVVALHGSASTGAQWRSLTGYIAGRFRVVTPDLPGYGASTRQPTVAGGADGLAADAEAIAALIEAVGGPVHLVGHSYGGSVALKLATLRPKALRSLTVIEPVSFHLLRQGARDDWQIYGDIAALAAHVLSHAIAGEGEEAMCRFVDFWNGEGAWARCSDRLKAMLLAALPRVCGDFHAVMFEQMTLADLAWVEVPALAVMGLRSPEASFRITELVARTMPRAALRIIPDAGHLAPLTDPHIVDPMIAGHLLAADSPGGCRGAIAA